MKKKVKVKIPAKSKLRNMAKEAEKAVTKPSPEDLAKEAAHVSEVLAKSKTYIDSLAEKKGIVLNDSQKRAVSEIAGPILVLAVPGSGKTTVLISRLANMIVNFNINPRSILTLTFSRRSAEDMTERYSRIFPEYQKPSFSTIHSFCYAVVQDIARRAQRPLPELVKNVNLIIREMALRYSPYLSNETVGDIVTKISYCNNKLDPDKAKKTVQIDNFPDFAKVYDSYKRYKQDNYLMDFDDMLIYAYKMFSNEKNYRFLEKYQQQYKYICVDEAQDTSPIQSGILNLIAKNNKNIFMVGDEDQSIYGFRGAEPKEILEFKKRYPKAIVIKMEHNYRSTKKIIKTANKLIGHNKKRFKKNMFTANNAGEDVTFYRLNSLEEQYAKAYELAQKVKGSTAVLFRYKDSVLPLVNLFENKGIGYSLKNSREIPVDSAFSRMMLCLMKVALNKVEDPREFIYFYRRFKKKLDIELNENQLSRFPAYFSKTRDVFRTLKQIGCYDIDLESFMDDMKYIQGLNAAEALSELDLLVNYQLSTAYKRQFSLLKCIAENLDSLEALIQRMSYLQNLCTNGEREQGEGAVISTMHASKGLEYDNVIVMDLIKKQFPAEKDKDSGISDIEEERRLCYVAVTRAKKRLYIIAPNSVWRVSEFVNELS